ncbi:MAG: serine/threonine protein kinase [Bilifractor sp.]
MFVGEILDGRYEILKEIGRGGMSTVYLAIDVRLHKSWAVKEIRKNVGTTDHGIAVHALMAEAEVMKKLDHPALPRIVDIIDSQDTICIVLDYVTGESLDRLLLRQKSFPETTVMNWFLQLAEVLHYLHSQRPPVIYRDMKPGNIMQTPEGYLKLIDFGIAREYKISSQTDTIALGTNGYAAPEQYGHTQTDPRSDIYSLGITIFELLTGISPGKDPFQYKYHPVRKIKPGTSESTEAILNRALAFAPDRRYQSCRELIFDLKHPERMDASVRRRQKIITAVFFFAAAVAGSSCMGGILCRAAAVRTDGLNYERKISVSQALSPEERIGNYLEAIQIDGGDCRAYQKILETYRETGIFQEKESSTFLTVWNQNQSLLRNGKSKQAYGQLAFDAGILYLYLYSGGDASFRNRVLKAQYFFQEAAALQDRQSLAVQAGYYASFCDFCVRFAFDDASVREPSEEDYRKLLESIRMNIGQLEQYQTEDAAYVRMIMYEEFGNLLNAYRKGMASCNIAKEDVAGILSLLMKEIRNLPVTQPKSVQLQEKLLTRFEVFQGNFDRTWKNTEQRKQAEGVMGAVAQDA